MTDVKIETLEKFYKKHIKEWMLTDLNIVKGTWAHLLTMLGCLIYTEVIGIFLPPLKPDIDKQFGEKNQKYFYRCLFRLESGKTLKKYDDEIREVRTDAIYHQSGIYHYHLNGIYHLRNQAAHKYLPVVRNKIGSIQMIIKGSHSRSRPPVPIFLEKNKGKISKIIINNVKYIEELEKLVDDVYDRVFNKKQKDYRDAMTGGYNKITTYVRGRDPTINRHFGD